MQKEACLALVRNQYEGLTRIERQIADYVLENSEKTAEMNVAELAKASQAAASAVIRFCQSIGYTGFSQFRLALAREVAANAVPLNHELEEGDSCGQIAEKVFGAAIRTLQNTAAMLDLNRMEGLVKHFSPDRRVCIFGVGTSAPVAEDAQYRFLELGYPASCSTDILFMPVAAANMKEKEIAVGISHSGRTKATIKALKLAKAQGAFTIAITSYRASPLAKLADEALVTYADDVTYPVEAVSARLAHMCILDALTVSLAIRGGQETKRRLAVKNQVLEDMRKEMES